MKALQGVEGHVEWVEEPSPALDVGQVRIKVAAAGLNRADLLQREGKYPPPPGVTQTLGLECSGVIAEVGPGSSWVVGDRVCALLAGGAMAEEVVVDGRHVLPVPEGLSLHEAAAIPEVYATAWLNLFELAGLKPGEKVLLHAGASGVGSAGIQLCKAFGNPVWVSVGSAERLAYCVELGAQGGVVRSESLEGLSDFAPFNVILDPVGELRRAQRQTAGPGRSLGADRHHERPRGAGGPGPCAGQAYPVDGFDLAQPRRHVQGRPAQ